MKESLQRRCELFINNRDAIKASFAWESTYIFPLCAGLCTSKNMRADTERMKACRDLLKQKTGVFSNFRGTAKLAILTMLSLSPSPERQLENMLAVYTSLKEVFWNSEYLVVASSAIAELAPPEQYVQITRRTREIYNRMKAAHPFLTSGEDSAFAALLALSGLDDVRIEQEMELCYSLLKPSFFSGNAVQSLSHVLALGEGDVQIRCGKALHLYRYLKERGYKYGTSYELSTLGALALLDVDMTMLAEEMMDVDNYLRHQRGFGAFGVGSRQRLMYAGILVLSEYVPGTQTIQTAALSGIVALVIAQQAAMCASIAATSAAASSASN